MNGEKFIVVALLPHKIYYSVKSFTVYGTVKVSIPVTEHFEPWQTTVGSILFCIFNTHCLNMPSEYLFL